MIPDANPEKHPHWQIDPAMVRARREAIWILTLWALCCIYTCTYCYLFGYLSHEHLANSTGMDVAEMVGPLESFNRDPETLTIPFGLGFPDWVFWGIVVPWVVCVVLSIYFCQFIFTEDELGHPDEEHEPSEMS